MSVYARHLSLDRPRPQAIASDIGEHHARLARTAVSASMVFFLASDAWWRWKASGLSRNLLVALVDIPDGDLQGDEPTMKSVWHCKVLCSVTSYSIASLGMRDRVEFLR